LLAQVMVEVGSKQHQRTTTLTLKMPSNEISINLLSLNLYMLLGTLIIMIWVD